MNEILQSLPIGVASLVINVLLVVIVHFIRARAQEQDAKMNATITELASVRAEMHQLETMLPQTYLTKHEFNQFRTEMNENFKEVHRDLKLILRGLGVKDSDAA